MVKYNPKDWFGLIFKFHKTETFRKLFWVLCSLALFSLIVVYIEKEVFDLEYAYSTTVHSLLGFVISLLLVFRTNTAYDRWWEGRKQWGALVNVSRNFALKINAFIPKSESKRRQELAEMTASYSRILKSHLRDVAVEELKKELPDTISSEGIDHVPNAIANAMQNRLLEMFNRKEISEAAYLAMLEDLNAFTDICGACERIKNTPIPYTYNIFVKKFIFIYTITMPFSFVETYGYWTILVSTFVLYTFASLEMIAEEIEDPFGEDANDLPTDDLAKKMGDNVKNIIS
jgi:putative membrane protein